MCDSEKEKCNGDGDGGLNIPLLSYHVKFLEAALAECAIIPLKEGMDPLSVKACEAMDEVWKMLQRMQRACVSKAILALSKGELKGEACVEVLPVSHRSIAHSLETVWDKEMEYIQDGSLDLEALLQKLNLCESAAVTLEHPILQEPAFEKVREQCKNFVQKFVTQLRAVVEQHAQASLNPLESFQEKYKSVTPAVQEWQLKEVDWIFKPAAEAEVKQDLQDFRDARKSAISFAQSLESLTKIGAQSDQLKEAVEIGKGKLVGVKECLHSTALLATTMVFTDTALNKKTTTEDIDGMEKFTQKAFGLGKAQLPEKLGTLLQSFSSGKEKKSKGQKDESGNDSALKSGNDAKNKKGSSKPEKEKRTEKDKDKGKSKDKDKAEKKGSRPSSSAPAQPTKKSKR